MTIKKKVYCGCLSLIISLSVVGQNVLSVQANKPLAAIAPTMWGVFFEDINFAADGGIYAELVKNRSFEFYKPMMGWKEIKKDGANGKVLIVNRGNTNAQNPRYANITINAEKGIYALSNEGFRGIGVQQGKQYFFSVLAKAQTGKIKMKAFLVSAEGKTIGTAAVEDVHTDWKKLSARLTATETDSKAHLDLVFEGTGAIDIDMVSLFPGETWKNRPNGLRADIVQMLADLKPGFIRFPGGCIVEGHELETRYQWKKTVGPVEERKLIMNRWNVEFKAPRNAPDYFQSYGLGFYEYFLLSEDLGAEPLPILNCGMACQYNTGELVPLDQLDPYIQDALDLIEFANGPVTSQWGKLRADMGHPEPFHLKMLGIGNEQWDEQYIERYKIFVKAIKQQYPGIELISTSGPSPDGDRFDYLWRELKMLNAEIIDEHYYKEPNWFLNNAKRYDSYDRKGPKVFAGEYAAHSKEDKDSESRNNWMSALSEAAFMTGLERNADVVRLSSYAPLLAHVEAWQWRPDLIWFDNLRTVGTPNYYVQKMFSANKGTHVIPALQNGQPLTGSDSVYASAVLDKNKSAVIIKIVNVSSNNKPYEIKIQGYKPTGKNSIQVLSSPHANSYNTLNDQRNIYPQEKKLLTGKDKIKVAVEPMSVNVIEIGIK